MCAGSVVWFVLPANVCNLFPQSVMLFNITAAAKKRALTHGLFFVLLVEGHLNLTQGAFSAS